jgi:hypothetical protein
VLVCGYMDCRWASGAFQAKEFDADTDTVSNTKAGVWAAIAVFLGYCLLQAPPTILVRPHPSFWRLIHGIAVVYMVFLTFLLFQVRCCVGLCLTSETGPSATSVFLSFFVSYALFLTDSGFIVQQKRDDARRFLKFLHPELGLGMSCLRVYSLFVA